MDFTVNAAELPLIEKRLDKLKKKLKGIEWQSEASDKPTPGTQCITLVHDDGTETDFGDTEWDADSYCKCYECKHAGTVGDFTEDGGDLYRSKRSRK